MNNKKKFDKFWPADLNIEGKDQIRGWWNSQMILSEIKFGKKPFDSVSVHGMVLDLGKVKMSKSLGNIISPHEIIQKYGRDYMRYYFAKISKGEDFAFDEKEFSVIQDFFRVFTNTNNFVSQLDTKKAKQQIEDRWILSRYNNAVKNIVENYNNYRFPEAVAEIEKFMTELSKTYIPMIRDRSAETKKTLEEIMLGIIKLLAPICPFVTEKIWLEMKDKSIVNEESIHLSLLPKSEKKLIDEKLEKEFEIIFKIIEIGLAARDKIQIGLKWPLSKAKITTKEKFSKELENIIARQLNVKKIEVNHGKELFVELDSIMTPELEAEGYAREISRAVQAERKKAGFTKKDFIEIIISVDKDLLKLLEKQKNLIKERVNAKKLSLVSELKKRFKYSSEFVIKEKRLGVTFQKML